MICPVCRAEIDNPVGIHYRECTEPINSFGPCPTCTIKRYKCVEHKCTCGAKLIEETQHYG